MENRLKLVGLSPALKYNRHINDISVLIKKSVVETFGLSLGSLRGNIELILYIANLIETLIKPPPNSKTKINKMDLLLNIMRCLIPAIDCEPEIESIRKIVEFLHSSGAITAVTKTAQRLSFVSSFLKKRFL